MNNEGYKEVYFDQYCRQCKYWETAEGEEPCAECLNETVNVYSHKPAKWADKG